MIGLEDVPYVNRVPVSTYRLQFHRGFRFADACALVPYLAQLGVTDCYSSPYLKASPGSTHGYDICDHGQLNPEIGTEEEYVAFAAELRAHGMGQIVDLVPNHMGVDEAANAWWRDVLENGPCSPFASFFDIDWRPLKDELADKLLLPILGDQYGLVLERGELRLAFADGTFTLHYFEHDLPINPRQARQILEYDVDGLRQQLGDDSPHMVEYLSIITALRNLPVYTETEPSRMAERQREKEVTRERLDRLATASAVVRQHIETAVRVFNGEVGQSESFDSLHALLDQQAYRLAYWRTAAHEINYRRFFDINQLAGVRMEEPRVFDATHALILRLIQNGHVTGLRIDHIDGLFAPTQYLRHLQSVIRQYCADAGCSTGDYPPFYVLTEKILSARELLPPQWPVAGTSGYDFLSDLNGLFVDRANRKAMERLYRRFAGAGGAFADLVYSSKKLIMDTSMASELNVLAHALNHLSERDRRTRDFTLNSLRNVLQEVIACFPIYRTYVTPAGFTEADRQAIDSAIGAARRRNPTMEPSIFDFVRAVLLPDPRRARSAEEYRQTVSFAMKFQQYTGPVQAKGVEDTAFYRYNLLVSLNEVGGSPGAFGCAVPEFHAANQRRRERWPLTMLASATHDTKRGEDARARLHVLSEVPEEWGRQLSLWARINNVNRTIFHGEPAPDRNDEYLFYQALVGAWPPEGVEAHLPDPSLLLRLRAYMCKALREAKVHTSWITQNHEYETAVDRFVERTLTGRTARRFLASFVPFQNRIARLGMVNSLGQVALKVACPGVPDFYQGTELWDLSLVDPDNRGAVDYTKRARMLQEMEPVLAAPLDGGNLRIDAVRELLMHWPDGRIKLFLTATALRLRRRTASLFIEGTYEPLAADGGHADHLVAFARRHATGTVIVAVPRLLTQLTTPAHFLPVGADSWGSSRLLLPPECATQTYRNVLTGEVVRADDANAPPGLSLAAVFQTCPVALLCASPLLAHPA